MSRKEHLTIEGLHKIVAIKASLNLGLSEELKVAFPSVIPVKKPLVVDQVITDPNWVAGFTSGEGCFQVHIKASGSSRTGYQIQSVFSIGQHSRDEQLMRNLISFFECGYYFSHKNKFFGEFIITKFENLNDKVIPFFQKYPILGAKALDFADFCEVVELMKNKAHLTPEGLEEIRKIKMGMNKGRE